MILIHTKDMFLTFFLHCLLLLLIQFTIAKEKDNENHSDVTRITIEDLGGDYSDNLGKEISFDGKPNEKAIVFPKKSLFSKDFKVSECTGSKCSSEKLSNNERIKMNKCNFEGHIISDPESKVSVVDCMTNGGKDISIVSEKTNLTYNNYRINSKGEIEVPPPSKFSDVFKKNIYGDDDESIEIGNDYSDDDTMPVAEFDMFVDKKMFVVTVRDVNSTCCRPIRTHCKKLNEKVKTCTELKGTILCEKGEVMKTCLGIKDYVKRKSENQQKKHKLEDKKEAPATDEIPSNIGEAEYDSDETEYDSASSSSKEQNDKKENHKSKQIGDLSKSDLVNLIKELKVQEGKDKTNPKCTDKNRLFRSVQVISRRCLGRHCRRKEPVPKQKVYSERTIEFGIFVDKHLYNKMSAVMKSSDNKQIKEAIVLMVHGLFIEVEMFLKHKTFTSLEGGFKVAINGIQIYKEHDDAATRKWDEQTSLYDVLDVFKDFSMKVNGACDADENSYDAMILLTGRTDFTDVQNPFSSTGYSFTGDVCKIAPAIVLMLRLDGKGSHIQIATQLLAHEIGHLLGSDHDGRPANLRSSIYYGKGDIPCPANQFLLSPTVYSSMTTWSSCTQKMIDAEYERREIEGKNCFFT